MLLLNNAFNFQSSRQPNSHGICFLVILAVFFGAGGVEGTRVA